MFLSDVIFPVLPQVYDFAIIAAPIAIIAEIAVFRYYNRLTPLIRVIGCVVLANLVSGFGGELIARALPHDLLPQIFEHDGGPSNFGTPERPIWGSLILVFFIACVLSIVIEYAVLLLFQKSRFPFAKLFRCTVDANLLSYVVLLVLFVLIQALFRH